MHILVRDSSPETNAWERKYAIAEQERVRGCYGQKISQWNYFRATNIASCTVVGENFENGSASILQLLKAFLLLVFGYGVNGKEREVMLNKYLAQFHNVGIRFT